ncbi:MAG: ATP-dependent sacrificial sulfur transferase LarE [Ruthenibacterium sp.]
MELSDFFRAHPAVAVAFSGGVDSAYLLHAAIACGAKVCAYFVKSAFQPQFELDDARKLAAQLHAELKIIEADVLSVPAVAANAQDRCYHCKKIIFSAITNVAHADGYRTLIDGTNASDDAGDRPGMRALREMQVYSPLRECGLVKDEIRRRAKEAGLFTWNKPAYACLATRIATGEALTQEKLAKTEAAEDFLASLGFFDFRVRMCGTVAKIQLPCAQFEKCMEHRLEIVRALRRDYTQVLLDLEARNE